MAVGSNVQLICKRKQSRRKMKKLRKMQKAAYASRKKVEEVIADVYAENAKKRSGAKNKRRKSKILTSAKDGKDFRTRDRSKFELIKALREDEAEIKSLSKKLGYNKRKSKGLPKVFSAEGLDYILEMCDFKKRLEELPECDDETELGIASNSGLSVDSHSEEEYFDDEGNKTEGEDDKEFYVEKDESLSGDEAVKEDIYGREIDQKSGKVIVATSTARRKLDELNKKHSIASDEARVNLERTIRGIVNRLNEKTLVDSQKRLKQLYSTHSHNDVKQIIYESINCAITVAYRLPDRIIIELAVFVALLHSTVSIDLSSYFIEHFTLEYLKSIKTRRDDKSLENMTVLIAELYNFKVIKDHFIEDVMNRLLQLVEEKTMECAKLLFTYTGVLLRKRNFGILQKCIVNTQDIVYGLSEEALKNQHLRFLTEEFLDVKNGNIRKWTDTVDFSIFEHYLSLYRGISRKEEKVDELGMSVTDIEQIDERGRWWLIGSAWNPTLSESQSLKQTETTHHKSMFNPVLIDMAKRANMNTPIRREVFCTLLSSEDECNAFEKLMRLSLKGQQEREIIHICLHCALQETVYNPFYSAVIERFCLYHKRFKLTIQYALWDRLKNLSNFKKWQQEHLATIIAELIIKRSVSLTVLKVIEFGSIDSTLTHFLRHTLKTILTRCNNTLLMDIFGKVVVSSTQKVFSQGLQIFIHMTMKDTEDKTILSKIEFLDSIWSDDRW